MKTTSLVVLMLICLACVTCKNADETCLAVPTTAPISSINLKFISKSTGADLIFGPGAPYKFSDLQATSSKTGAQPFLLADSTQKNDPIIKMIIADGTQNLTLKLGALPADSINAVFTIVQRSRCNSYNSLSSIYLDGKTVCSPCSTDIHTVTIAK